MLPCATPLCDAPLSVRKVDVLVSMYSRDAGQHAGDGALET